MFNWLNLHACRLVFLVLTNEGINTYSMRRLIADFPNAQEYELVVVIGHGPIYSGLLSVTWLCEA